MTARLVDPMLQLVPGVDRHHFACRFRLDLHAKLKATCERFNCSQGVLLELLIEKALAAELVKEVDCFAYSTQGQRVPVEVSRVLPAAVPAK